MIFGSSRSTILTISTLINTSKSLHKLPLNLCTKLLPKKMYKFDQSCPKPILSPQLIAQNKRHFLFIITTSLTILPTKLMTPHIEGSQQRYAQKYMNCTNYIQTLKEITTTSSLLSQVNKQFIAQFRRDRISISVPSRHCYRR